MVWSFLWLIVFPRVGNSPSTGCNDSRCNSGSDSYICGSRERSVTLQSFHARAHNSFFFPARDEEWNQLVVRWVHGVIKTSILLNAFPKFMRPYVDRQTDIIRVASHSFTVSYRLLIIRILKPLNNFVKICAPPSRNVQTH